MNPRISDMTIVYPIHDSLYVNLTNRCPCACRFCVRQRGDGVHGSDSLWLEREPTVEEVCAALDAAELRRYHEVVFCGYGEPTERLDALLEVAEYIRRTEAGMPIRVNTNGLADLICGGPTAIRFVGRVDSLSVSLNAETPERYLELCRPKFGLPSHAAMLAFAADAVAHGIAVTMTVVGTPDMTPDRIAACRRLAEQAGATFRVRELI